jgi:hypothetical protein
MEDRGWRLNFSASNLRPLTSNLRRRKAWHIRKQEEVLETAEIALGSVWA